WTWLFPAEELKKLLAGVPPAQWRETAIDRLATLYQHRMDWWRHDRTRSQLRERYLYSVSILLLLVLASTSGILCRQSAFTPIVAPAMLAGALGSVLSAMYKLRDEILGIRQLRSFMPVLVAQPLLGATAALVVYVVFSSGLIKVANLDPATFSWHYYL